MRGIALRALLLSAAGAVSNAQVPCFEGNGAYYATGNLWGAAIADLDGDGDSDFVVGGAGLDSITVVLDQGGETFVTSATYATGSTVFALVLADLDGDGDLDIAATGFGVSVLMNLGAGAFAPPVTYTASGGYAIAAGDVDMDGDLDLVVGSVSVMMNQGAGTFAPPVTYPMFEARDVAIVDLDGDGDPDLAVASRLSNAVLVLLNLGNGTFGTVVQYATATRPMSMAAGDFDGDGHVDFATANEGGSVSVLRSAGDGTLLPRVDYAAGELSGIATADFDGDGDLDLVVTSWRDETISLLSNQGTGMFSPSTVIADEVYSFFVELADVDRDGDSDVVASLTVFFNDGHGSLGGPAVIPAGGSSAAAADVDGDGDQDLVIAGSTVWVVANQGAGSFGTPVSYPAGANPGSVAIGDLDGDGDRDVVVCNRTGTTISVLRNNGSGVLAAPVPYPTGLRPQSTAIADIDSDGDRDVVVVNSGNATASVLRNVGNGTFAPHVTYAVGSNPVNLVIAELDGVGNLDLAVARLGGVSVLLSQGSGTFGPSVTYPTPSPAQSVAADDINGDGARDLIVGMASNPVTGNLYVLMNQGFGTFAAAITIANGLPGPAEVVAVLDLDGDGDRDICAAGQHLSVLPNLGGGAFGEYRLFAGAARAPAMALADFDGDGDTDAAVPRSVGVRIARNCTESGRVFCTGDGSGTACPCGNNSPPSAGAGCVSMLGIGATLRSSGTASVAHDRLVLRGAQMPIGSTALYFQGTSALNGGAGVVFGAGLRCAGGTVRRLGTKTNVYEGSRYPEPGDPRISLRGHVDSPGERFYQCWYRNSAVFCPGTTSNLTNGERILWGSVSESSATA